MSCGSTHWKECNVAFVWVVPYVALTVLSIVGMVVLQPLCFAQAMLLSGSLISLHVLQLC